MTTKVETKKTKKKRKVRTGFKFAECVSNIDIQGVPKTYEEGHKKSLQCMAIGFKVMEVKNRVERFTYR